MFPAAERGWRGGPGPRLRKRDFPETRRGLRDCACAAAPHLPPLLWVLPELRGEGRNVGCGAVPEWAGLQEFPLCFVLFAFCFEIITYSQKVAKLVRRGPVYPSPTQLPSTSYITILHYRHQETDIGTGQLTRPMQLTRLQPLLGFIQFSIHSFVPVYERVPALNCSSVKFYNFCSSRPPPLP